MSQDAKHTELKALRIDRNRRRGGRGRWAWYVILIGIVLVALLSGASLVSRFTAGAVTEVEVVRVRVESPDAPAVVLSAGGYVVAHHKINVNSKVTGRIAWIGVEKGDKVRQGQVLVRLEDQEFRAQVNQAQGAVEAIEARLRALETGNRPEEIQQAWHNLEQAIANRTIARISLDRYRKLTGEGVTSRGELDDAIARFDAADQQVRALEKVHELLKIGPRIEDIDRARGDLAEARGRLAYQQTLLEATEIRAPISGTILERTAEKGELVTSQFASGAAGGPRGSVVSLADLTDLQVELDISQDDFSRLTPRQRGIVTADAFPDRKYQGAIDEISPEANRQKATVQVKVKIFQPDEYLRPEMNAHVEFIPDIDPAATDRVPQGVLVPAAALREEGGKKLVLLAFKEKAVVREVRIVSKRTNGYLVEGLTGGEDIIINSPANLRDGDSIRIRRKA
jgi:HlyD family secretion protein